MSLNANEVVEPHKETCYNERMSRINILAYLTKKKL